MKTSWLACLAVVLGACPSVTVDENEGVLGPTVEFDPGARVIPFPNNLLLNPETGKLNLPQQCNESAATTATRENVLNKLDGFGTYETVINVTFTEPVNLASLEGRVLLFQRVASGEGNDPLTAVPLPVVAIPGKTVRFGDQADLTACTDPQMIDQVTFISRVPLEQKSTYTVALLQGIKTENEVDFNASFTWSLVREPQPVVVLDEQGNVLLNRTPLDPEKADDLAQIQGIDLLWNAHHDAITFLAGTGHDSEELLLAFEFNTQTVIDPLDPAIEGSPASAPTPLPLLGNASSASAATGPSGARLGAFQQCAVDDPQDDAQCFLRVVLGAGVYADGVDTCVAAGCDAVGDILGSILLSKQYRADVDNTGYTGTGTQPIPGAWSDPLAPSVVHNTDNANPLLNDAQAKLEVLTLIPATPAPADGFPVVIFQHGITRAKTDAFGTMRSLVASGFAVVAIDASNHGSRAVRISNADDPIPVLDCEDVNVGIPGPRPDRGPDPTTNPSCYAPIFSSDLAATRDGFRQSILDIQQLVTSVKACGLTACGKLKVDVTKIAYVGHSLGGIFGGMAVGLSPDISASVLNSGAVGWIDILENTAQVAAFQCPLVDALIDAGSLTCNGAPCTEADKFDPIANTGLCLTDAWKSDPGYRQFAVIGRWVLDAADPANFAGRLASTRFLIQRVDDDEVFPNIATDNMGALVQQLKADASCGIPTDVPPDGPTILPSSALIAGLGQSQFLDYVTTTPGSAGCPVGNTYGHGSLLQPEDSVLGGTCVLPNPANCDGTFATGRLQTDMAFFLLANLDLL